MDYNKMAYVQISVMEDEERMNQTTVKQNPFVFYLCMLAYMVLALLVRVIAFAPLYCLTLEGSLKWIALLCPVLLVFFVLPLRYSFAEAVVPTRNGRFFDFKTVFGFAHYGEKLTESIMHALNVLKWGIPLAAMLGYAYYWYTGVDALTVLQSITGLGAWGNELWCTVLGFFGVEAVPSANTLMDGVAVVLIVLAIGGLIWLYGAVRNSASRYVWVIATRNDRAPRVELRRRLRGRRMAQLGVAVLNLILWVPFVLMAVKAVKGVVSDLSSVLMMAVMSGSMPAMDLASAIAPLAAAFFGLYLPLLPVRRWLTAAFAAHERRRKAPEKANIA